MEGKRLYLVPIAWIYGFVVRVRNLFFDIGILKSYSVDVKTIVVGNICAGGSGKTPHIEYLIGLFKDQYKISTLSRGYGRKTKGFIESTEDSLSTEIGDEPRQFKQKHPELSVCVCEDRVLGVNEIMRLHPNTEIVLLDDAFQHRKLKSGFSIVLTDYYSLYTRDYLLPAGQLREPASGAKRADIIVITKTPVVISPIEKRDIIRELKLTPRQIVCFSYINYGEFQPFHSTVLPMPSKVSTIFLISGIANSYPLVDHLKRKYTEVVVHDFPDHYEYKMADIEKLVSEFNRMMGKNKIILTTEKDYMRFSKPEFQEILGTLPLYYIQIDIAFHGDDALEFKKRILDYVKKD